MIAHHGLDLAQAAEADGAPFSYEAAVAGGIPVIKGFAKVSLPTAISQVYGILNGTCNYILSTMEDSGRSGLAKCWTEAQAMGYAEPIPTLDIEGTDAAHKLSILSAPSPLDSNE